MRKFAFDIGEFHEKARYLGDIRVKVTDLSPYYCVQNTKKRKLATNHDSRRLIKNAKAYHTKLEEKMPGCAPLADKRGKFTLDLKFESMKVCD
ncbi:hypothetical protein CEXT_522671 [Caerostris extrusa]|uniref:Transposase n=1 Tax=Caerostris extrusa TaxID=172846 RepID=A0AAV4MPW0_CAEEX|nr:hypothetical protein CEXT_522671 [Caerostris extrusa]